MPIGDLAVREPDHKRLIAFLKAMEFNSLMRRVAEFSEIEAGEIEPDTRFTGSTGGARGGIEGPPTPDPSPPRAPHAGGGEMNLPLTGGGMTLRQPAGGDRMANFSSTPRALAAARVEAARNAKFDRAKYETVRSLSLIHI